MTNTCQKNIGKAIKKTNELINEFIKEYEDPNECARAVYINKFRLNTKYKLEIEITPIGIHTCELIYYIDDNKDQAIDQINSGTIYNNHDYIEKITKDLVYLLNMYC